MSLPSISAIVKEMPGISQEEILVEAMRRDLPLAVEFLHQQAHLVCDHGGRRQWLQDPNSPIGKQLIRLHASDALRQLASKHFCHGAKLMFVNCCGGILMVDDIALTFEELLDWQIKSQVGPIAYADC